MLRGRISKLWGEAVFQSSMKRQHWINKRLWAAKLIEGLLHYSLSLWKFRCSLLHGQSQDKAHQKLIQQLQSRIIEACTAFLDNPHIVPHSSRNIFLVPLEDRLKQDVDSLQCFLRSYALAKQHQEQLNMLHTEAAAQFFFPRSLPQTIVLVKAEEMSTCSDCTYASPLLSPSSNLTSAENSPFDQGSHSTSSSSISHSAHQKTVTVSPPECTDIASE
jgi:hypothetical protein